MAKRRRVRRPTTSVRLSRAGICIAVLTSLCGSACSPRAAQLSPPTGEAPTTCWSLQRSFRDSANLPADTAVVPSSFALGVTTAGVVVVPGTSMRGRWDALSADSVQVDWGQGRWHTWLFGVVHDGRFRASGHVFGTGGASALVTYEGTLVPCTPKGGVPDGTGFRDDRSA